jgi:hypothetical protein
VQEDSKLSGYFSPSMGVKFPGGPNGLAAFSRVLLTSWPQIVAFCGLIGNTGLTLTQRKGIGQMKNTSLARLDRGL